MKQRTHQVPALKKPSNILYIEVDQTKVPSKQRRESRLKNKSQVFDDRRFRKPKYKKDFQED